MTSTKSGDVVLIDEEQNIIEVIEINIGEIIRLVYENMPENELKETFCLQFIDPYGDTVFNLLQIGVLKKEFEELFNKCGIEKDKEKLQIIIDFISKAEKSHIFVKFWGD